MGKRGRRNEDKRKRIMHTAIIALNGILPTIRVTSNTTNCPLVLLTKWGGREGMERKREGTG